MLDCRLERLLEKTVVWNSWGRAAVKVMEYLGGVGREERASGDNRGRFTVV